MRARYVQLQDGQPITINPQKGVWRIRCCDCGLAHTIEFAVGHRQKLTIRAWRDNRRTAALRREKKKREKG